MPADFSGKWKPVQNEGVEEYFGKLGVNSMKQCAIKGAHHHIEQNGAEFKVIIRVNALISKTQKFKIGEEMDEKDPCDRKMKVCPVWDGEKLRITMTCVDKDMKQVHIREMDGDEMKMEMELFEGGQSVAKASRVFQRE